MKGIPHRAELEINRHDEATGNCKDRFPIQRRSWLCM